ncbi:hypothetical protein Poli38472_010069 [Pythium oligandrum]|uniref:Uncharacterized protein n=1 Tax=Pythium oligandrum TaxID=41045 RepID=A0A8K1C8N7_PYTOL|nr:hypothetical protein Poli38472_010069 [Pythium oligandrum]|eukprot:TMW58510.1 hypothetical protein Poli38472_010069 [Pythium oligandrum]
MGGKKIVTLDTAAASGERINSPRSLEACLRSGIEPDELLPKSPKDFWDRKGRYTLVEKEAATIRFQHFEQLRLAKLDAVRRERDAILAEYEGGQAMSSSKWSPGKAQPRSKSAGAASRSTNPAIKATEPSPGHFDDDDEDGSSTMLMLEERRLQRMKMRQQKEIQGVIEMESKMAKLQQENARRTAEEVRKKLEYQKELRTKRAALMAQKHEREIQKKKQEDLEAQQRRLRAKQEAEKEKKLLEEEEQRQIQRKKEAAMREMERSEKAEEFRRQTEALLKQQEDMVQANRQRMLEKERQVMYKMECANKKRHLDALERREKANARIHQASMQNQLQLQKRKEEFDVKQAAAAERARDVQRKTMNELKERAALQKKEEEIRQKRLEAARKHQQDSVSRILTKRQTMEQKLDQINLEREKERALQAIEKSLSQEEKLQNVERLKRVDAYNRMQMLNRIAEEDDRSRAIKEKKQAIMQARQKVALESLLRKHKINQAMDQLRMTNKWDKIEETLYAL